MFLLHFAFFLLFLRYGFSIPVIIIYFTLISSINIYNYVKTLKKTKELEEQHEPAIFLDTGDKLTMEDSFSSESWSSDEEYYDDNGNILTTDIFKCRICKQRKCLSWQLIPRYEVDPITTFVECVRCGYKWKF